LHGYVNARVEEHERHESEHHRTCQSPAHNLRGDTKASSIRKEEHHSHGYYCANKKIRYAPAESAPCLVGQGTNDWLDNHTHEWWKNPEETKLMWIGSKSGEYT
jgi:hypothetical protein